MAEQAAPVPDPNDIEVVHAFLLTSSVLVLKLLLMVVLTARYRYTKKLFMNPEDAVMSGGVVYFGDEDIERTRSAHLSDLLNIFVFLIATCLYVNLRPRAAEALTLLYLFLAARLTHTATIVLNTPQLLTDLCFFVGFLVTVFIGVVNLIHYKA